MSAGPADDQRAVPELEVPEAGEPSAGPTSPPPAPPAEPPQDVVIGPLPWSVGLAGLVSGLAYPVIIVALHPYWNRAIVADGGHSAAPHTASAIALRFANNALVNALFAMSLAAADRLVSAWPRLLRWSAAGALLGLALAGVHYGPAAIRDLAAAPSVVARANLRAPASAVWTKPLARATDGVVFHGLTTAGCGCLLLWAFWRKHPVAAFAAGCALAAMLALVTQAVWWQRPPLTPAWLPMLVPWRVVSPVMVVQLAAGIAAQALYGACIGYIVSRDRARRARPGPAAG